MIDTLNRAYLGRGWAFPPSFNKIAKNVEMVSEEEDIQESLHILLSTRPGERTMQPDYGCNLDIMLFEPLSTTLITLVKETIRVAILYFEARIDVSRIQIIPQDSREGLVLIEIDYRVRSTNSRFNFVYPFYLNEGSGIETLLNRNSL